MRKKIFSLLLSLGLILGTSVQANAVYYVRPSRENINEGYNNDNGVPFDSIKQEYYKEDYMWMRLNEVRDITDEYDKRYIKYYNIDRIVLIDYTYKNLQYKSMPMFEFPKIVFRNATVTNNKDCEYIPTQLFSNDCEYLEHFSNHPALRPDEEGSWKVVYEIHNKLNGEPHKTIDINLSNMGNELWNKPIWSIPIENLSK